MRGTLAFDTLAASTLGASKPQTEPLSRPVFTEKPKEGQHEPMTQALYRKWRPQTWDEVVGQDHVIRTLQNALRSDRISHAYLFSGPRGTGKTTTARLVAKAVNCLEEDLDQRPCGLCKHCLAIQEGTFLDLIEIDAASNTSV
ncbi:MAG: AAA family ATPase, partial [Anaerolineales bacterium]